MRWVYIDFNILCNNLTKDNKSDLFINNDILNVFKILQLNDVYIAICNDNLNKNLDLIVEWCNINIKDFKNGNYCITDKINNSDNVTYVSKNCYKYNGKNIYNLLEEVL